MYILLSRGNSIIKLTKWPNCEEAASIYSKYQLKHVGGIGKLANQHFETPNETIYSSQDHSWMLKHG